MRRRPPPSPYENAAAKRLQRAYAGCNGEDHDEQMKPLAYELFMALANVTSCMVGLDQGRVYTKLADETAKLLERAGPLVGAAPEWYGGKPSSRGSR